MTPIGMFNRLNPYGGPPFATRHYPFLLKPFYVVSAKYLRDTPFNNIRVIFTTKFKSPLNGD